MVKPEKMIDILSHSRHDWLNVIQLIKGNIALNRLDRVDAILETVIQSAQNESKLSNLNAPRFAVELLTYNWGKHGYELEYEVIGEIRDISPYEGVLMDHIPPLLNIFNEQCDSSTENHLLVTIDLSNNQTKLSLEFFGNLHEILPMQSYLEQVRMKNYLSVEKEKLSNQEVFIVLCL